MAVKERVGRPRHIAFRVEAERPVRRGEMVGAIRGVAAARYGKEALDAMAPWLTEFDGGHGLVRVRHTWQERAVEALRAIRWIGDADNPAEVTPLGVSGTIRAARRKHLAPRGEEGR